MSTPENPPAFPGYRAGETFQTGLSLRDYFAAQAPRAPRWWIVERDNEEDCNELAKGLAEWAYIYADAMLAERSKP